MAIDNENLEMVEVLLDNKVSNCFWPTSKPKKDTGF